MRLFSGKGVVEDGSGVGETVRCVDVSSWRRRCLYSLCRCSVIGGGGCGRDGISVLPPVTVWCCSGSLSGTVQTASILSYGVSQK